MSDLELNNIKSKLLWSVSSGWAARIEVDEAEKLLGILSNPTATGTVDKRELPVRRVPRPYIGDPGDEHHE